MGLQYDFAQLRRVAVRIATQAAELVETMRDDAVTRQQVHTKSSETDVVTAADREGERFIRAQLAELRPGDPVLGEEEGGDAELDGLRWVVDPIDGTVNYLYGFPWYSVSIAAEVDGRSVAGAVVEPSSGRVWSAASGHGAELDGQPLHVSQRERLNLAMIGTGFGYSPQRRSKQAATASRLLGQVGDIRRAGAASLDLCAVGAGWLDGYYEHGLQRWDWAAGALIAVEAGAHLRLPQPGCADGLGDEAVLCAAPGIATALTEAVRECGAAEI